MSHFVEVKHSGAPTECANPDCEIVIQSGDVGYLSEEDTLYCASCYEDMMSYMASQGE